LRTDFSQDLGLILLEDGFDTHIWKQRMAKTAEAGSDSEE
jgi:hypothetical protein